MRRDIRVTVSSTATASAISPATWPVSPDSANASGEAPVTGRTFGWPACVLAPGAGLGAVPGLIAGNRPDALPAPMSDLDAPFWFRFGIGPSGSVVPGDPPPAGAAAADLPPGEAGAAARARP